MSLGEKIKKRREELGLSQEDLALCLDINLVPLSQR